MNKTFMNTCYFAKFAKLLVSETFPLYSMSIMFHCNSCVEKVLRCIAVHTPKVLFELPTVGVLPLMMEDGAQV